MTTPTQLDRIEAKATESVQLLRTALTEILFMATSLENLQAALDALNTATSQEAALLTADSDKLDKIQALITDLVNTAGIPQSVIDQANAISAALGGVIATTTEQAARLDQLGTDPRNPVPVKPPNQ